MLTGLPESTISVVLVSPLPPPLGGHTVWTAEYLAAAQKEGVRATLVDTSPGGDQVNVRSGVRARRVIQMATTLRQVHDASTPDCIAHVTTTWFWSLVRDGTCARLARRHGAAVVLHVHASTAVASSLATASASQRWLLRHWLRPVDAIIVLSEELVNPLRSVLPHVNVAVVPNWVNTEEFRPHDQPVAKPPSPAADRASCITEESSRLESCRVLFVGRLMAEKGFFELADAVGRDQRLHLVTIGDRPHRTSDDERSRIDAALLALDATGRHEHHPSVARNAMAAHYRNADVFALPSWNEGLPISLLEAMASGLPCVVTAVGGMADLVAQHSEVSFAMNVAVGDAGALALALSALADDPERRRALGRAGRQIVLDEYAPNSVFEQLRAVYAKARLRRSADR